MLTVTMRILLALETGPRTESELERICLVPRMLVRRALKHLVTAGKVRYVEPWSRLRRRVYHLVDGPGR